MIVPGLEKPVASTKVEEYVNEEFLLYYDFYTSFRHAGPPWAAGWLEWPPWVPRLVAVFDGIIEGERIRGERKFQAALHGARLKT